MTRAPFAPVGERPRWELIYDLLSGRGIGDVITYDEIAKAVDLTRTEFLTKGRPGWYKAMNRWGEDNKRALRPVPGEGYRVVEPWEHEPIAKAHHRKSRRSLRRSRQTLANADRSLLDDDQRQRFDRIEATIGRHEDMIRRLSAGQAKVEKAVAKSQQQHAATDEQVAELRQQVSALEDALRRHGMTAPPAIDPSPSAPPADGTAGGGR